MHSAPSSCTTKPFHKLSKQVSIPQLLPVSVQINKYKNVAHMLKGNKTETWKKSEKESKLTMYSVFMWGTWEESTEREREREVIKGNWITQDGASFIHCSVMHTSKKLCFFHKLKNEQHFLWIWGLRACTLNGEHQWNCFRHKNVYSSLTLFSEGNC